MKNIAVQKRLKRLRRKRKIREIIHGTPERPRLVINRSLNHIYGQVIDDAVGKTLVSVSSLEKEFYEKKESLKKVEMSTLVGEKLGQKINEKGIKQIKFDRNGYLYHGRVKAFAEGVRKSGIDF